MAGAPAASAATPAGGVARVVVVGGGPAGLIAAERLATAGAAVVLLEQMPTLGRKLLMAGRGGLNLTHSEDVARLLTRYRDAGAWLAPSIQAFPPDALRAWAHGLGQETFVGSSGRVFPTVMKASPLLRALIRRLEGLSVEVRLGRRWTGWSRAGEVLAVTREGKTEVLPADATLLALGGASWPRLGSDGTWVPLLADDGVDVRPLVPANMGLHVAWSMHVAPRFAGRPLKRIEVAFGGHRHRGEAIVTRDGLEGGAIYAVAAEVRDALAIEAPVTLHLDLRPDLDHQRLAERLSAAGRKPSMATLLAKAAGLDPVASAVLRDGHGPALPRAADALAAAIKHVPITITATAGMVRAISSAGGVALTAVDERFMLRARPGVFVAGEMLDWEAPTGGYLLQATFSTAVAAANGAMSWLAAAPAPVAVRASLP